MLVCHVTHLDFFGAGCQLVDQLCHHMTVNGDNQIMQQLIEDNDDWLSQQHMPCDGNGIVRNQ